MKNNKKAFTIVELVIVIAVIAILAAVLIPTFVSLIRRSRISNDTSLVRNLNEALAEDRVNNEHNNMTDVLAVVQEYGYIVANLNAKAKDNEILWDSVNDVFCYLNDGEVEYVPGDNVKESKRLATGDYRLWKIYNKTPTIAEGKVQSAYSIYVANQAVADAIDGNTISTGFDIGECTIDSLTYVNESSAQDVVIRTNSYSTVLTIDAENDTVTHYGKAKNIDVDAVDNNNCYNEHGDVLGNINLKQGKVVVHEGCKAAAVVIDMTAAELASVTTISADNSKQPNVPIILNTSEALWQANPHNELVDPSKNTIIYSHKGGTLPDNFNTMTDAEKEQAIANAETVEGVAAIQNVTYTSLEEAYEAAEANDTIVLLKDVSYTNNEVFYFCKSITLNGNNKTFTATGNKASYAFYFFNSEGNVAEKAEIKNLTINTTGYQAGILTNDDELTYSNQNILHLNNVTITSQGECIYANGNSHVYASNCNLTRTGKWKAQTGGNEIYYSALIIGYGAKVDFKDSVIVSEGTGVATFPSGGTINVYNTSITVSNPDNAYVHSYAIWSRIGNGSTSVTEYADAGINVFSGDIRGTLNTTDESTIHDSYLIITGGTFDNDPAPYVDSYSYNVSESAGIYTVTAK